MDLKLKILECVEEQRSRGIQIRRGIFGVRHKEGQWVACNDGVCALGAVILNEQPVSDSIYGSIGEALGVGSDFVDRFVDGFDGYSNSDYPEERMGAEIYQECAQ